MKKFLSVLAVATIAAGLTVSVADAKPRKSSSKMMSTKAGGTNSANSMGGKNSPASNAKGSASSAGGGEK
ncbi:hypothetical protein [Tardiphaga sp.]|uniref:hypothetical protein n=1 Tax=Tardiphaga sp. TaxID=1926292 RepID=UPI0037D9F43D